MDTPNIRAKEEFCRPVLVHCKSVSAGGHGKVWGQPKIVLQNTHMENIILNMHADGCGYETQVTRPVLVVGVSIL